MHVEPQGNANIPVRSVVTAKNCVATLGVGKYFGERAVSHVCHLFVCLAVFPPFCFTRRHCSASLLTKLMSEDKRAASIQAAADVTCLTLSRSAFIELMGPVSVVYIMQHQCLCNRPRTTFRSKS